VLLVSHCLVEDARAGTESYVSSLGRTLADEGVDILFLAPAGPPSLGRQESITWREIQLEGLPYLQFERLNLNFLALVRHAGFEAAFHNILQQHQVDLVHFHHTYLSSISLLEVALDQGLPVVLTLHDAWHLCPLLHCINDQGFCGGPEDLQKCTLCLTPWLAEQTPEEQGELLRHLTHRRRYVQSLFSRCRLLAPSRFLRNLHYRAGVAPGQIIHLPLGLDELGPASQAPPEKPPRFVFLGNIIPVKRVDLAVAAFIPLAGQAVLEIWGGLPAAQEEAFRESLAPYPHIRYRGPYRREDLPRLLAGAAATVVPSDFENCPLVVRESLMLGVPVIASRAGGLPEIIRHGENGLLFSPGDAAALRRSVRRFLNHPELGERLRQGISPVKTMTQDARDVLEVYRSFIDAPFRFLCAGPTPQTRTEPAAGLASVIIPTYNNLALTRSCLKSIQEHTSPGAYEIIVVDNGSTDGTPEFLREMARLGLVRVLLNNQNLGFGKACNQGAHAARGEFLLFLNNDTVVTPGWLEELVRGARENAQVAAVGAKLLYPDDTVQHAGVSIGDERKLFHIYKHFHKDHPAVNKERTFQCLTAACLLVKRRLFFQVGGFNEEFENGYEDVDLCLNLVHQGFRLLYNPRAVVYHLESKTPGRFDREAENSRLLVTRWRQALVPDSDHYFHEDGIFLEHLREHGQVLAIMHDSNDNPFWEEARRLKKQGRGQEARECYRQAWNFNPYDVRRQAILQEWVEVLEILGEQDEAAKLRGHMRKNPLPQCLPTEGELEAAAP